MGKSLFGWPINSIVHIFGMPFYIISTFSNNAQHSIRFTHTRTHNTHLHKLLFSEYTLVYTVERVSVVRCRISKAYSAVLRIVFVKSSISEIHVPFCNSYIIVLHISHHQFFIHCVSFCFFPVHFEHGLGQCFNSFCHSYLKQTCKHNSFYFIFFTSFFALLRSFFVVFHCRCCDASYPFQLHTFTCSSSSLRLHTQNSKSIGYSSMPRF